MSNNKHLALLNKVQRLLIDQANASGTNLADEFETPQDFKDFVIAFTFKGLMEAGATTEEAFDAVCGEGECKALFDRVTAA